MQTLSDIGYVGGVTLSGRITERFPEDAVRGLEHIRSLIVK